MGLDAKTLTPARGVQFGLGAGGAVRATVPSAVLREVALGALTLSRVKTYVLPEYSALGYGALRELSITLDLRQKRLWFSR